MALAIFDLDGTLIGGDSDALWGEYLVERGVYDAATYGAAHRRFLADYHAGRLDIQEFLAFQLRVLAEYPLATLHEWREEYLRRKIQPIRLPKADALIEDHRQRGDTLLIITATNRFITAPIAELLGIESLIATDPEMVDGRYTGRANGVPSFAGGKVTRLQEWLRQTGHSLQDSWCYSDSRNDLPLLEQVTQPVAVDPDPVLEQTARQRGWQVLSLR
jgi:HAD superfamily hydrolase (TIGR01490 family)